MRYLNPKIDHPLLLGLPWTSVLPVRYRLDGKKKNVSKVDFFLVLLASLLALPWPPWSSIKLAKDPGPPGLPSGSGIH